MNDKTEVPLADTQRLLIEQFTVVRKAARANWNRHILIALVPFGLFMWGGQTNRNPVTIASWVLFAVIGVHGYLGMRRTRRCPACDSFVAPRIQIPYLMCETCGVRLSVGMKDEM
jgi:hypothetical protein